jgi:hypothetical protein
VTIPVAVVRLVHRPRGRSPPAGRVAGAAMVVVMEDQPFPPTAAPR